MPAVSLSAYDPGMDVCPTCGRPNLDHVLTPEEIEDLLERSEGEAVQVLVDQLSAKDERVRQSASKALIEWRRGKPKQQIQNQNDNVTVIRYESAAWVPPIVEAGPPKELQLGTPG